MKKLHRNDPCPCGSGEKAKRCCWDKIEFERLTDEAMFKMYRPLALRRAKVMEA